MLSRGYSFKWSNRHSAAALALAGSASAVYAAYSLYRYHGYFSRAGIRPVSEGDLTCEVKRAVDEYLQFHYATVQEILPYSNSLKVQHCVHSPHCVWHRPHKGITAICRKGCNLSTDSWYFASETAWLFKTLQESKVQSRHWTWGVQLEAPPLL